MRRRKVIGAACVVLILAIAAAVYYRNHLQAREAQRQLFLSDAARYEDALRSVKKLAGEYNRANDAFTRAASLADKAANERRKDVFASSSLAERLAPEKQEQSEVDDMLKLESQRSDIDDRIATAMEATLTVDDVDKFRTDAQAYHSEMNAGLGNWYQGIGLIVDGDIKRQNGEMPPESDSADINRAYQQTTEELARTKGLNDAENVDYNHLKLKIKSRLHDAQLGSGG